MPTKSLLTARLENISRDLFKRHNDLITSLIGNSPGIYALYDDNELYYVGKSIDLKKRVKQHLKDKHESLWSSFSLYLVNKEDHIHDIESLLIRIANPKGNTIKPSGKTDNKMKKELEKLYDSKMKVEKAELFGNKKINTIKKSSNINRSIAGLVTRNTKIIGPYKGKEYSAILTSTGKIKVGNKNFTSPTGAAKAIVTRTAVNGWRFWYIQDSNNDWVKLCDYK